MTTAIVLGVDVGTSDTKVLATTLTGVELGVVATKTQWRNRSDGGAQTDPDLLSGSVFGLLDQAVAQAVESPAVDGRIRVAAVSFTGMAEAGVLLDSAGRAAHPIIAWFDQRGRAEMASLPDDFRAEFPRRTGLPVSAMATLAKLLWMRSQGTPMVGRWFSVPEYLVHRLGGAAAAELSLASRTGLLDQDTADIWPAAFDLLGASPTLLPPRVLAGTPLGRIDSSDVSPALRGAVLTVAGHDHPVAAVGSGSVGADEVFDSFGTAEALVRSFDGPLDADARDRLAGAGINAVQHVLPGRRVLLAGTKAGLLLRRTLTLLGAADPVAREALDREAFALGASVEGAATEAFGATVSGSDNNDGVLRITVEGDDVGPAGLWLAALDHVITESERMLAVMAAEVGPARTAVIAGGWTRMQSVRRAKLASLPGLRFSQRSQAGAFGAAMFAAHAADVADLMSTTGDHAAIAVDSPSGPSPEFAAAFTGSVPAPIPAATMAGSPTPQESRA